MDGQSAIRETVLEYVKGEKLFTSVDISNAIKQAGFFVRNREVTAWLHANRDDQKHFPNYDYTMTPVRNDTVQATLYYPCWKDPADYKDTNQRTLTPRDVANLQRALGIQPTKAPVSAAHSKTPVSTVKLTTPGNTCGVIRAKERVKISGKLIKTLGWKPGDTIDTSKIKTKYPVSPDLVVNKDYRVSIPRHACGLGDDPIKVSMLGGEIIFEKA